MSLTLPLSIKDTTISSIALEVDGNIIGDKSLIALQNTAQLHGGTFPVSMTEFLGYTNVSWTGVTIPITDGVILCIDVDIYAPSNVWAVGMSHNIINWHNPDFPYNDITVPIPTPIMLKSVDSGVTFTDLSNSIYGIMSYTGPESDNTIFGTPILYTGATITAISNSNYLCGYYTVYFGSSEHVTAGFAFSDNGYGWGNVITQGPTLEITNRSLLTTANDIYAGGKYGILTYMTGGYIQSTMITTPTNIDIVSLKETSTLVLAANPMFFNQSSPETNISYIMNTVGNNLVTEPWDVVLQLPASPGDNYIYTFGTHINDLSTSNTSTTDRIGTLLGQKSLHAVGMYYVGQAGHRYFACFVVGSKTVDNGNTTENFGFFVNKTPNYTTTIDFSLPVISGVNTAVYFEPDVPNTIPQSGWIIGYSLLNNKSYIYRTTDAGTNWTEQKFFNNNNIRLISISGNPNGGVFISGVRNYSTANNIISGTPAIFKLI